MNEYSNGAYANGLTHFLLRHSQASFYPAPSTQEEVSQLKEHAKRICVNERKQRHKLGMQVKNRPRLASSTPPVDPRGSFSA